MTSQGQALQPRKAQQGSPTVQRRFGRSHSPEHQSDLKSAVLTVSLTLLVSFVILRQLDLFSSGEWPESDHVTYLLSDEDREAFQARIKAKYEGPVVLALYSESCLACRRMRRHFVGSAEKLHGVPFYAAQVGETGNYNLAAQFGVTRIPAILVLRPTDDKPAQMKYEGKPDLEELLQYIKDNVASSNPT